MDKEDVESLKTVIDGLRKELTKLQNKSRQMDSLLNRICDILHIDYKQKRNMK